MERLKRDWEVPAPEDAAPGLPPVAIAPVVAPPAAAPAPAVPFTAAAVVPLTASGRGRIRPNHVRRLRVDRMMTKAELARRAGVSPLTVDRVERGLPCRMDTKRKVLTALGLSAEDRVAVFGEDEPG